MKDLSDLAKAFTNKKNHIDELSNKLVSAVALKILTELELSTPVDTSKALSNWIVTLESRSWAKIPAHFKGSKGSTRAISIQESVSQAIITLGNRQAKQAVYITNNLEYIKYLNDGSSTQAPAGFFEASVAKGKIALRKLVI